MNFFTSDQHFGHGNIIQYCDRPFMHAHQMDRRIIESYNSIVGSNDTCYFIGDFTMSGDPDRIGSLLGKLAGNKVLVLGNHDKLKPFTYVDIGFASVHTSLQLRLGEVDVVCIHDPAAACGAGRWLVGHIHNLFKTLDQGRVTNVGVDVWNFAPVSEEALFKLWEG